ncbi:hypothetical protein ACJMK2_038694 [Sinanodonta woodiana]|uniref:Sodefrin-like factor n=1 Tax=Sinanodonta woodiana TaxID=1069815 RepID=A0ABD3W9R7_SINWO
MDAVLTSSLEIVYNGGCRSNLVCNAGMHLIGKKGATDHVLCSSCCNTTNRWYGQCNNNLCGIKSSTGINETNQCYYCGPWDDAKQSSVADPQNCRNLKTCADDEVCSVSTVNTRGLITYELGCKQLLLCQIGTIMTLELNGVNTQIDLPHLIQTGSVVLGRKRQLDKCDVCCGDGLCNDASCEVVRRRIVQFAMAGRFNYTSLTLIR